MTQSFNCYLSLFQRGVQKETLGMWPLAISSSNWEICIEETTADSISNITSFKSVWTSDSIQIHVRVAGTAWHRKEC